MTTIGPMHNPPHPGEFIRDGYLSELQPSHTGDGAASLALPGAFGRKLASDARCLRPLACPPAAGSQLTRASGGRNDLIETTCKLRVVISARRMPWGSPLGRTIWIVLGVLLMRHQRRAPSPANRSGRKLLRRSGRNGVLGGELKASGCAAHFA